MSKSIANCIDAWSNWSLFWAKEGDAELADIDIGYARFYDFMGGNVFDLCSKNRPVNHSMLAKLHLITGPHWYTVMKTYQARGELPPPNRRTSGAT